MSQFCPNQADSGRNGQRGMTLMEIMVALFVLTVGLGALTTLLVTSMAMNNRNNRDTTATLLAHKIIEQIASVNPAVPNTVNCQGVMTGVCITDCAGNAWPVNTADAAGPSGAGANLVTSSSSAFYGAIDQTQSYSTVPSGYAMQYVDCSIAGGTQTTYDVRWNIMTLRSGSTRLITASARPLLSNANMLGGHLYAIPVNLRSIGATP